MTKTKNAGDVSKKAFKGYIQVYTGKGRGKTTAALGVALRAAGHGLKTYIGQFLKACPQAGALTCRGFKQNNNGLGIICLRKSAVNICSQLL